MGNELSTFTMNNCTLYRNESVEPKVFRVLIIYVPDFKLVEKLHGLCYLERGELSINHVPILTILNMYDLRFSG